MKRVVNLAILALGIVHCYWALWTGFHFFDNFANYIWDVLHRRPLWILFDPPTGWISFAGVLLALIPNERVRVAGRILIGVAAGLLILIFLILVTG